MTSERLYYGSDKRLNDLDTILVLWQGHELSALMTLNTMFPLWQGHQTPLRFCYHVQFFLMTSSNGTIFRVTGPLCGEFTGPGEFPAQKPVTRSFNVFFDLRLIKRLSKQPWGWWFETPSWSLWRHCNVYKTAHIINISDIWHGGS